MLDLCIPVDQRQTLDVPGEMMNGAVRCQNDRAARTEREADQTRSRDRQRRLARRSDLDNAAFTREGSSDVKIAVHIEGDALRSSQTAKESRHVALRGDFVNAIKTRSGGPGHEHISMGAESQVVGRNARFESRKYEDLTVRPN